MAHDNGLDDETNAGGTPDDWEPKRDQLPHPSIACPECDDVSNECCELCRGTDQHCPVCYCPAEECEFQEGADDDA